jgi:hypothetical protein
MADREWYWFLTVSETELRRLDVHSRQDGAPVAVGFVGKCC